MAYLIATVFGIGRFRPAPGTWGALAGLALSFVLADASPWLFLFAIPVTFVSGHWATRYVISESTSDDPSEVVIDEVLGQMVAILPVVLSAWWASVPIETLWPGWVTAFVAFRLFDIWKPWPVSLADRRHDALGVMLDDVIAGAFAALVVVGLAVLAHGA